MTGSQCSFASHDAVIITLEAFYLQPCSDDEGPCGSESLHHPSFCQKHLRNTWVGCEGRTDGSQCCVLTHGPRRRLIQ